MRLKKIALTLCACMALGGFAANAAQAEGTGWTIGSPGVLLAKNVHEKVNCKKHTGSTLTFSSSVLGIPVALTAEGIDCLEKAGSTNPATIDNTTSPNHSEGVLTFTEVTVETPTTCTVSGSAQSMGVDLTTNALTDTVIMDPSNKVNGPTYDKFFPETTGGAFIEIEFTGASCPFANVKAPVKGTACGEAVSTSNTTTPTPTGTQQAVQTLTFGAAQQSTGGCALTLGTAAATLSGAVDNSLASGVAFGSD